MLEGHSADIRAFCRTVPRAAVTSVTRGRGRNTLWRLLIGQCRNAAIAAARSSLERSTGAGPSEIAVTSTIRLTAVIERNRRSISYKVRQAKAFPALEEVGRAIEASDAGAQKKIAMEDRRSNAAGTHATSSTSSRFRNAFPLEQFDQ